MLSVLKRATGNGPHFGMGFISPSVECFVVKSLTFRKNQINETRYMTLQVIKYALVDDRRIKYKI